MPKWIHFCQLLGRRVRRIPVRYPRFRGDLHVNSRGCRKAPEKGAVWPGHFSAYSVRGRCTIARDSTSYLIDLSGSAVQLYDAALSWHRRSRVPACVLDEVKA